MTQALANTNLGILDELITGTDRSMGDALSEFELSVRRQAALDIYDAVQNSTYSMPQVRAMFYGRYLSRARALDYAHFRMIFNALKTIRDENLAQIHPAGYTDIVGTGANARDRSFLRMANEEAGIAISEASDIMTLGEFIIPALRQYTEWTERDIFERIKKTNLRAMVPVLRVILGEIHDGDDRAPNARVVQRAEETQMRWAADVIGESIEIDNAALAQMTNEDQDQYLQDVTERRARVRHWLTQQHPQRRVAGTAEWILTQGEILPTEAFRTMLSTNDDTPVPVTAYRSQNLITMTATMTHDQYENWRRILRERAQWDEVDSVEALVNQLAELRELV